MWTAFGGGDNKALKLDPRGCDTDEVVAAKKTKKKWTKPNWEEADKTFIGDGPFYVHPEAAEHKLLMFCSNNDFGSKFAFEYGVFKFFITFLRSAPENKAMKALCMRPPKCSRYENVCMNGAKCFMFNNEPLCSCPAGKARGPRCEMLLSELFYFLAVR